MMRFISRGRIIDFMVIGLGLIYLAAALLPMSRWYEVGELAVSDTVVGEPIHIEYHGGAVQEFLGSYTVIVRDFDTRLIACDAAGGPFMYEAGSPRPSPLMMGWWAPSDSRCQSLPSGVYVMETCWTVHQVLWGLVPPKTGCVAASFTVRTAD